MDKIPAQKGYMAGVEKGTAHQHDRFGTNQKVNIKPGLQKNGQYEYGKGPANGSIAAAGLARLQKSGGRATNDRAK